ncbi:hypothetical protein AAFM46_02870 [Arthrobacter sp. TMP15]|uniref:hypothetical protein n=1 Tax=Arthrobacter sp. TMP15 TaxID=3140789 RepID=UPI0031BA3769
MNSAGEQDSQGRSWGSRMRAAVVPVLALAAVITGILLAMGASGSAEVGWFAYAPLSNEMVSSNALFFIGPRAKVGLASMALGLMLLAFWSGYRTAVRRKSAHF